MKDFLVIIFITVFLFFGVLKLIDLVDKIKHVKPTPPPTVKPSGKLQVNYNNQTYFTNENPQVLYSGQCVLIRVSKVNNLFCGNFQVIGNLEPVK
jgi:hypothetical protein